MPYDRARVWRALAVLEPYCAACDVSYVLAGSGAPGRGTRFVCFPGRLGGAEPPPGAPRGEILEWEPRRRVTTRLELTPESWTTRIELADAGGGGTRVTVTVSHQPRGGNRFVHLLQRAALQRMVQRTVDTELDKVPQHVTQVGAG